MPTYEYRCPAGHDFEKFYRKISDAGAEVPCPQCGKVAERMISAGAGLVFKGSGFYITDYGKDGKKDQPSRPKARTEGGGDSAPATGSDSGGSEAKAPAESKPATAETKPAAAKESTKSDAAPAKSTKPTKPKPSTE